MIAKRDSVSLEQRLGLDAIITDIITEQMGSVDCVGTYASIKGEVDTYFMIQNWLMSGVRVCLPRIEGKIMNFYEIKHLKDLKAGTMGILEPIDGCEYVDPSQIQQLYIPMVGFNDALYRLGHGAGFYDKYLVNYNHVKIGLAYSYQKVTQSFQENHDIPVDLIITNEGILYHTISHNSTI